MGRVECRVFGGAELSVGGTAVAVDTRKALALLAYLVVEGRASRDTLAALLWPESDDSHARSSLRRTLSALRSATGGGGVDADRRIVSLSAAVTSDLGDLRDALAATTTHDHPPRDVCPECLPLLEEAVGRYRGDFLAGFSLRDAPDFDDWARTVAEGLRLETADALDRLATGRAAEGDYRGAVEAAERWIDLDPLHEPAYRSLMMLSAWAGDRPGVIEAYRRCVAVLNVELGVAPLEETSELYEAILDDDLPPAPSSRRPVRAHQTSPPDAREQILIDRRRQLDALNRELAWAGRGGRVTLVTGDSWMGKTRLLDDFTRSAVESGNRVLLAHGYRAEQSLAYGVAVQLLRSAAASGWLTGDDLPDWVRVETGRLLPETGWAPPDEGFGETRLFDAVVAALLAAGRGHTMIIAIDDGQWLDPASTSLLSYLSHRIEDEHVLLVIAVRTDPSSPTEAAPILGQFAERGVEVALTPLEADDIAEHAGDPNAAGRIIARTAGIPMLVAEHLGGDGDGDPSLGVRRYIEARLATLDGLGSQVVAAAAVLGGMCDVTLLLAASGRSEDEVVDAVDDLIRRRILREVPGGTGLAFTLEAMERLVYEGLTPVRRRLLHRRAASALVDLPGAGRDPRTAAVVADHLREGGQEREAASWYATAGDLAASVYAHAEAEAAYRSALAMGHPARGPLNLALGEVLLTASRFGDALDAFQAAAAVGDPPTAARAEHGIGEVHRRLGRFDHAEHHFSLAEPDHPDPSALYADWALLEHRRGAAERAADLARRAVRLAGDTGTEGRARDILGIVTDDSAELQRALELAGDDPALRMAALNSLAHRVAQSGDLDEAVVLVNEGIELSERVGDRHRRAALLNHLADLHHRAGRAEASQQALTAAVRLFADVQPDAWEPEVWLLSRW